jgi:hypothetical protein
MRQNYRLAVLPAKVCRPFGHYEQDSKEGLMRNSATTMVALLLVAAATKPAQAQQISVGARAGYTSATIDWEGADALGTDWTSKFHFGGLANMQLHDYFAVQLEVWYSQKGSGLSDPEGEGDVKVPYLEIPLLAKLTIPTGGIVTPHVLAGPAVAFELSCTLSAFVSGIPVEDDCDAPDIGIDRKKTDFSLVFGAGLEIQAGPGAIILDALYDLGLKNLADAADAPDEDVKTRAWMISGGYSIPVWSK